MFCFCFFFSSRRRHTRWPRDWSSDVCSSDLPLVVAGEMRDGDRVAPALTRLGLPVLAEPGSQLRRAETGGAVESYEALLRAGWSLEHGPDLVIRIGGTPTSRPMNAWLAAAAAPTFLIDPDHSWRDQ